MKTRGGLIEIASGWSIGISVGAHGQVLMLLQYDPKAELPSHGVKQLPMTVVEASELSRDLEEACRIASGG